MSLMHSFQALGPMYCQKGEPHKGHWLLLVALDSSDQGPVWCFVGSFYCCMELKWNFILNSCLSFYISANSRIVVFCNMETKEYPIEPTNEDDFKLHLLGLQKVDFFVNIHHIALHPITSHYIPSHHITSHHNDIMSDPKMCMGSIYMYVCAYICMCVSELRCQQDYFNVIGTIRSNRSIVVVDQVQ